MYLIRNVFSISSVIVACVPFMSVVLSLFWLVCCCWLWLLVLFVRLLPLQLFFAWVVNEVVNLATKSIIRSMFGFLAIVIIRFSSMTTNDSKYSSKSDCQQQQQDTEISLAIAITRPTCPISALYLFQQVMTLCNELRVSGCTVLRVCNYCCQPLVQCCIQSHFKSND